MKNFSVLGLAIFCLAASVLADQIEPTKEQLEGLEKLLAGSPLEDADAEFDDGPDGMTRTWNPISWIKNKLKNKCKCEATRCDCCFKLKLFANTACLNVEQLVAEKAVQIVFKIDDKELVNKKFTTERNDQACGIVPTLPFLKYCFTQQSEEEEDNSITSCSSVDFRVGSTVGAVLQFRCLQIKDGKISFGGFKEVEKSQALVVKVKNPFRAAVALYRKAKGNQ
uniref:Pseudopodium-enriched atypical kinase 1 n=1 Tax=Lygus hesperus TaxID=30085 RepID=A0A0A9Y2V5_LYGHE